MHVKYIKKNHLHFFFKMHTFFNYEQGLNNKQTLHNITADKDKN